MGAAKTEAPAMKAGTNSAKVALRFHAAITMIVKGLPRPLHGLWTQGPKS